jgi:hypothetical protein
LNCRETRPTRFLVLRIFAAGIDLLLNKGFAHDALETVEQLVAVDEKAPAEATFEIAANLGCAIGWGHFPFSSYSWGFSISMLRHFKLSCLRSFFSSQRRRRASSPFGDSSRKT